MNANGGGAFTRLKVDMLRRIRPKIRKFHAFVLVALATALPRTSVPAGDCAHVNVELNENMECVSSVNFSICPAHHVLGRRWRHSNPEPLVGVSRSGPSLQDRRSPPPGLSLTVGAQRIRIMLDGAFSPARSSHWRGVLIGFEEFDPFLKRK